MTAKVLRDSHYIHVTFLSFFAFVCHTIRLHGLPSLNLYANARKLCVNANGRLLTAETRASNAGAVDDFFLSFFLLFFFPLSSDDAVRDKYARDGVSRVSLSGERDSRKKGITTRSIRQRHNARPSGHPVRAVAPD